MFQRTPNYSVPAWNAPLDPEHVGEGEGRLSGAARQGAGAADRLLLSVQRQARLGGARPRNAGASTRSSGRAAACPSSAPTATCCSTSRPTTPSPTSRAEKIRGIVKDPATADLLCPDNVFGCKRLCVDTGYFDTYNKPHVKLVDVSTTPIERFTAEGIVVAGTLHRARRRGLRHRVRGHDRLLREDPHHRPGRADARREMAGRAAHLSRASPRRAFPTCS